MKYKLHTTSARAWKAMSKSIDHAKKSIFIEMYIFDDDTHYNFIQKIKQKAASGVQVVIVADAYGSKLLKNELGNFSSQSKIEFIFFSHWLRHIHRKILIIDEKTAFLGGVNIGRRFRYWNDLELELRGQIVKRILKSFAYTYSMAGGKNPRLIKLREEKIASKLRFWLLEHSPIRNIYTLKDHYAEKITHAKKSIQFATPYFAPPGWLISLLDDARRRNIQIEIIVPQKSDYHIVDRLNYRYMYNLFPLGIKFYLTRRMNHSKLLIIDGEEGLIGSQNLDPLSFRLNSEVGIFFKEKKLLKELSLIVEKWKHNARLFEPGRYQMHALDYLIFALIKIFHPIL